MHILRKTDNKVIFKAEYIALLAVLSAEGIVPKLLWTRRVTNGDVISAQKWLPGQKLEPEDMKLERVAKLLKKIHSSKALVQMIQKTWEAAASRTRVITTAATCFKRRYKG